MKLVEFTLKNRAAAWMIILILLFGGYSSYEKIGRLEDPEFTVKQAVVITPYPGADVHQVETEVTEKIETAIQQLKQLYEITSISRPGMSVVKAEMKESYGKHDLPQIWDELRRKIHDVREDLPPGVREPIIGDDFGDVYGEFYALTGDGYDMRQLEEIAKDIRLELLRCDEVGKISFYGDQQQVIYVEIDRDRLASMGLSPMLIAQVIHNQNAVVSGGMIPVGPEQMRLEISGDFEDIDAIGDLMIADANTGAKVMLKDVARITKGFYEPANQLLYYNGQPAIGIGISTVLGGNVLVMGESVNAQLREIQKRLPVGVEIHTIADQAASVESAVNGFVLNLLEAVAIVLLVLIVFMGFRQGLIIGVILVLTILSSFIWMKLAGIILQRISLGALIIALGMLVDNAIVVVEGISIKIQRGLSRHEAALASVKETQWPLLGATIIAILAFASISLSNDSSGEFLRSLFQVIAISLGMSWVLAVTITPFLSVLFLKQPKQEKAANDVYGNCFFRSYRTILGFAIRFRWATVAVIIAMLFTAFYCFRFVDQNFFANSSRPQFLVGVFFPEGTRIEETRERMLELSDAISDFEDVADISTFVGQGAMRFMLIYSPEMPNPAYGQLLVSVDDWRSIAKKMQEIREFIANELPNATPLIEPFRLGTPGASIEARIEGPDPDVLYQIADQYIAIMRDHPNLESIRSDWGNRAKKIHIELSEAAAKRSGVSRKDVAQALEMNRTGYVGGVYLDGDHLLPIIFRIPESQRVGVKHIEDLQVWSSVYQQMLPLGQIVESVSMEWDVNVIHRFQRKRTMTISTKQIAGNTAPVFAELRPLIEAVELPEGYHLEWGGEFESQSEANEKLGANIPLAMFGMLFVSILLFKSFRHPFIIFSGLPLALIGVVSGLLLFQQPFGFMAMLGFLSLSGMLIKNEIVLLEQINIEIAEGKAPLIAVLDASVSRVRPVCMAAFTTVLGMIPLIWDPFFGAMAVTIMGGLSFATVLTLIYVPVLYTIVFRIRSRVA